MACCDLHVHSVYSIDSGNFALRRARLGESFTPPERVYDTCRSRGMTFVTISDHNTLEGALRLADRPGAFLSVEVTTRFPEDDVPLHVLVWNLAEEDHRDLQPLRGSVYELAAYLRGRGLVHALAHPLYRMGPPLTVGHVERMMLLFGLWEGRNGARPKGSNELASRLAASVSPAYLEKLSERHGLEPAHAGRIALTGGSDDHGALDLATTWTEAAGADVDEFLASIAAGGGTPCGEHGSTVKLAHAVGALALNAYRCDGRKLPPFLAQTVAPLFDDAAEVAGRHDLIEAAGAAAARMLAAQARSGGVGLDALPAAGDRLALLLLAGSVEVPYLASMRHHAGTREEVGRLELGFFGLEDTGRPPRALVFTDTYRETNGVAGTMRQLAAAGGRKELPVSVVTADAGGDEPGLICLDADWTVPLPVYESLELRFPMLTRVLARVENEVPDVIHVATPGPVGLCGLAAAKLLGLPLVGSYHTELGPYALHLTRDAVVADLLSLYVGWFYRQCARVLAPTAAVARQLEERGLAGRTGIWGRGVDSGIFTPRRRSEALRAELLGDGDLLLLSVGRLSDEKRLDVLLRAFDRLRAELPGARLAIAGDGPARSALECAGPDRVLLLGEVRGSELADLYASADIFCFPSTTDTFGQVLLEAAASGLPAVAAAAGGAPELVEHWGSGVLVGPDDPVAFAEAVGALASSEPIRARLGARAREIALTRSWDGALEELRSAYAAVACPAATDPRQALHV